MGLLVVALVAFLSWKYSGSVEKGGAPGIASVQENSRLTAIKKSLGSAMPRRKVEIKPAEPEEPAFDPYEAWETTKILDYFAVPTAKFEGVLMAEALQSIREIYAEYGGKNLEFRIEGGGGADPGFPLEFETGGSLRAVLELVAGVGGYDLNVGDGEVALRRKLLDDDGLVQQRIESQFVGTAGSGPILDDPFGEPVTVKLEERVPAEIYEKYGIGFANGAGIEIEPETGDWMVTQTAAQLDRVRAVDSFNNDRRPLDTNQILMNFAFVQECGG